MLKGEREGATRQRGRESWRERERYRDGGNDVATVFRR